MVVGLVGCGRWGRHILRDLDMSSVSPLFERRVEMHCAEGVAIVSALAELRRLAGAA